MKIKRLIHSGDDISRLAEDLDVPTDVLERDYLLMAIAAELTMAFPTQICFKGGFVLRHSLGFDRLSGDIDATRSSPPKHKFAADEIKTAIQAAARRINFAINVPDPETDSAFGLDFDSIAFTGLTANKGFVDVEISYREKLCRLPEDIEIGPPFYEPFKVPAMAPSEMMAEKVRALTQRLKHHDLADAGYLDPGLRPRSERARRRRLERQRATVSPERLRCLAPTLVPGEGRDRLEHDRDVVRSHEPRHAGERLARRRHVTAVQPARDRTRLVYGRGRYARHGLESRNA